MTLEATDGVADTERRSWMKRKHGAVALLALACMGLATWGAMSATAASKQQKLTNVTLQLKWVTQAQFAGYYAAASQGYYKNAGLNVKIKIGGPSITPETVVVGKQADFGLDWLPSLYATREKGSNLVSIAQVFERSGMTELTWKSSGINTIAKMKGKKVGVWCCGNQPELFAALTKNGINPNNASDVTIVNQPFSMDLFLRHQVDAAAAMTYNELAQVLETKNPATGKLYTLNDLNVFKMASPQVGTAMLEDNVFVRGDWLKNAANQKTAVAFLKASFQGWIYCRDHQSQCVDAVLKNGSLLGKGHQTWQMNEINKLIWPNTSGIGVVPASALAQTARIAKTYGVIKKAPVGATNYTYARTALAQLKKAGVDVYGKSWKPATVQVTPGGK
jgi:NitT/TauT family transport system substrate-binding protein